MSDTAPTKGKNRTLIILIVVVAIILAILVGLQIYQKIKDKKALEDDTKKALDSAAGSATQNPIGYTAPKTGNDFPLQEGSTGERVKFVQAAINRIAPTWKLKEDGVFGHGTYTALITGVGTKYYPVTLANYTELLQKSTAK